MLKTGRVWRGEGTAKEDDSQEFSAIDGTVANTKLTFKVFRVKNSSKVYWEIGGRNEITLTSDDLVDLSKFRDSVEKGVKWLEAQ
jgi:hypothetical protein